MGGMSNPEEKKRCLHEALQEDGSFLCEPNTHYMGNWNNPLGCIGHCDPALIGPLEHEPYEERESNP
jgi:hypothetical protein